MSHETEGVGVAIPSDIGAVMSTDLSLAVEWRHATRVVFRHYLSRGYEVSGFERGPTVSRYVLTRIPEADA